VFRALDAQLSAFVPSSASVEEIVAAVRTAALTPRSFSAPDLAQALARRDRQRGLLSAREQQILRLLRDGATVGEIARAMALGESTVKTYISRLYDKLGVSSPGGGDRGDPGARRPHLSRGLIDAAHHSPGWDPAPAGRMDSEPRSPTRSPLRVWHPGRRGGPAVELSDVFEELG
jgi:DNA-binding CsgD family transcriptional regulator